MIRAEPMARWLVPTRRQSQAALGGISRLVAAGIGGPCVFDAVADRVGTGWAVVFVWCALVGCGDALERIAEARSESSGIPDNQQSGN